jgi:hypothetical protein
LKAIAVQEIFDKTVTQAKAAAESITCPMGIWGREQVLRMIPSFPHANGASDILK